ncbi:hypothetical protein NIES4073_82900 [Kalymmatonema gypsitolerans NIES-4073]|nr:hypothetical protein NIES4073_82900 [Scytonema sp. NIES-4073]
MRKKFFLQANDALKRVFHIGRTQCFHQATFIPQIYCDSSVLSTDYFLDHVSSAQGKKLFSSSRLRELALPAATAQSQFLPFDLLLKSGDGKEHEEPKISHHQE